MSGRKRPGKADGRRRHGGSSKYRRGAVSVPSITPPPSSTDLWEVRIFEVFRITAGCSRRARGLILVSSCPYEKSRIGRWRREAGKTVPRVRNFGENVFLVDFRPFSTPHIICWLFVQTPFGYSDSPSNSASAGTTRKFRTGVKIVLKTPRRDAGRRFSA